MSSTRVLTGITTSGTPHLGNYVGAIRPAIAAAHSPGVESYYFLADYHSLVKTQQPARVQRRPGVEDRLRRPHLVEVDADLVGRELDLEQASAIAERLPKALIHRNVPGERVHELPTSHSPFLSRPDELADILRAEVRAAVR